MGKSFWVAVNILLLLWMFYFFGIALHNGVALGTGNNVLAFKGSDAEGLESADLKLVGIESTGYSELGVSTVERGLLFGMLGFIAFLVVRFRKRDFFSKFGKEGRWAFRK